MGSCVGHILMAFVLMLILCFGFAFLAGKPSHFLIFTLMASCVGHILMAFVLMLILCFGFGFLAGKPSHFLIFFMDGFMCWSYFDGFCADVNIVLWVWFPGGESKPFFNFFHGWVYVLVIF